MKKYQKKEQTEKEIQKRIDEVTGRNSSIGRFPHSTQYNFAPEELFPGEDFKGELLETITQKGK